MECSCKRKAVYFRRYSGQRFCKKCFNNYFERKVLDTIRKYNLIERGENVALGISGGKDSTVLLHILKKLSQKLGITLHPILIDEGIKNYREHGLEAAKKTCNSMGLHLTISSFENETDYPLDTLLSQGELKPCTYCGVIRRKILNKTAKELSVDKLAVGHNLDDEAQVIMMNYLAGDIERLHRLTGNAKSSELIKRIKPLSQLPEKEVMLYAILNNLEFSSDECPYATDNHRTAVREFLNNLELERPGIKFSVIRGWERIIKSTTTTEAALKICASCGQSTARETCRSCELTQEIKIKMRDVN